MPDLFTLSQANDILYCCWLLTSLLMLELPITRLIALQLLLWVKPSSALQASQCCLQLLLLLGLIVFLLCLPVRLVLLLCCGVKLDPPGQSPPGGDADEDASEETVINMPPETAAPQQVPPAWSAVSCIV